MQKCLDLCLVHSSDLTQALLQFLFRTFSQGAISIPPCTCEPFIQFPRFEMETFLPLCNHPSVRRDFQHPSDIKNNCSDCHSYIPYQRYRMEELKITPVKSQ